MKELNSDAYFQSLNGTGYSVRKLHSGDGIKIFNGFKENLSNELELLPFNKDPVTISEFICEHITVGPDTPGKDFWLVLDHKSHPASMEGLVQCRTIRSDPGQVKLRAYISESGRKLKQSQVQKSIRLLVSYFFNSRRKQKIRTFADTDDIWLQTVFEGAGFKKEGCLRENRLVSQCWRDEFLYGLLRRDLGLLTEIRDLET